MIQLFQLRSWKFTVSGFRRQIFFLDLPRFVRLRTSSTSPSCALGVLLRSGCVGSIGCLYRGFGFMDSGSEKTNKNGSCPPRTLIIGRWRLVPVSAAKPLRANMCDDWPLLCDRFKWSVKLNIIHLWLVPWICFVISSFFLQRCRRFCRTW